jgi:hypothetical protein
LDWIGEEHVGSSYVDLAVCSGLEMKPLLDEREKQHLQKSHRSDTRLESQLAVVTACSTNTKHNTNFTGTEVIANIWTYIP